MGTGYDHLFRPLTVGDMKLRNRVMLPPHASAVGNLWGTEAEAERNIAYWASRANAGAGWIDGITGFIENPLPPGFEPTGVGAMKHGVFRLPHYLERAGAYAAAVHAEGAAATTQMVIQGGMPHAPGTGLSGPLINQVPHALDRDEIRWFVKEYRFSASQAQKAGLDGVELHANHDDLMEWFLSPLTNRREDAYGGSFDRRMRFITEILTEIRDVTGPGFTIGIRMNMSEGEPGGYDLEGGAAIAGWLADRKLVDYVHLVMGSPWGDPSYIQPHHYPDGGWAAQTAAYRRALSIPIVYTGRITAPDVAERALAAGHADVLGMARAHFADGELLAKAKAGRTADIRPCIGCNECISRRYVENLPFACAVNPDAGREVEGRLPRVAEPRRLLVVGGGPAGLELAMRAAERGHRVSLWEAADRLGGQVRLAAKLPTQEGFLDWIEYLERRLAQLDVDVRLNHHADTDNVLAAGMDMVAVATGAGARWPDIEGLDQPFVHDVRAVLAGGVELGRRVHVIVQDDHSTPLALADLLAGRGHDVTLLYQTPGPAPLVGRYTLGAFLARLSRGGVRFRHQAQALAIEPGCIRLRNVFSFQEEAAEDVDSVVLACGSVAEAGLYADLKGRQRGLHLLGDAFAPRRIVFATQQAYALAARL
ncbi:FAD-dependent oxidoreductase [Niveispirillum sp. KHB5.9]|uniref:oxidoreductase n=1 Tax=Niveispirillum sp. KHB5.9 TaxID=3400269 RepID=UPI003A8AB67B